MITPRRHKFSKLFFFKANLIHIPDSFNRAGIDPLPRFFVKPTKLQEVLNYSENPSSVNAGYRKEEKSGLYVKNIDVIDSSDVASQFEIISSSPPFGFRDSETYSAFMEMALGSGYSEQLEATFSSLSPKIPVDSTTNPDININHFYVEIDDFTTWTFYSNKIQKYPKNNRLNIRNITDAITSQVSSS